MRLHLATLLALLCLASAPPSVAVDDADAWDGCVQYMYVADYHWYWACADPKDLSCPVYFKQQHGATVTKECLVETAFSQGWPACILTSGGLDYPSWLCVDPRDPRCPVYTLTTTDWGVQKRCFGVLPP